MLKKRHNLHVPLPDTLYLALTRASTRMRRTRTDLAREAIALGLREIERQRVAADIAEYAREMGGTSADLDTGLEAVAVEHLLDTIGG